MLIQLSLNNFTGDFEKRYRKFEFRDFFIPKKELRKKVRPLSSLSYLNARTNESWTVLFKEIVQFGAVESGKTT